MVFFSCDQCGESLKKSQVEKHTFRCRSQSYSCMDCQVCFTPQTYQQHVKCVTENQKYGSKNYVEKEAKGEVKQNAWCVQVERAIEFVKDPKLKSLLRNIQGYSNIPRKELKFINFLTNSCKIRDKALCHMAWKAISDEAEKLKKDGEAAKSIEKESREDDVNAVAESNHSNEDLSGIVSFKWKATIKRKLREAGGEMKVKKLRKAVVNAYKETQGEVDEDALQELFESKLWKAGVTISGSSVSIQT